MNMHVIMISDFNETAWAIEDTLVEYTGSRITWMTSRRGRGTSNLSFEADLLIIDSKQFDVECAVRIGPDTPVILLVDGYDVYSQSNLPENFAVVRKSAEPSQIVSVFETLRNQRLTRLGRRSSPSLSATSRR